MNPSYDFNGQVALVTGAGSGIGLATARAFATAGAAVALADVDRAAVSAAADELNATGHRAIGIVCDVTDDAQVQTMVQRTVDELGGLDLAFNNAGVLGFTGELADESLDDYDRVAAVNLRGVWSCLKHEVAYMRQTGAGAIVNTSSLGGLVGQANRATYHATKHGVIGLTKSVAMDYAAQGIRVNAVCPGVIETPMFNEISSAAPEVIAAVLTEQPIGRLGQPEEVAGAVLWLCSPGASFVIGVALPVDGGFVAH